MTYSKYTFYYINQVYLLDFKSINKHPLIVKSILKKILVQVTSKDTILKQVVNIFG